MSATLDHGGHGAATVDPTAGTFVDRWMFVLIAALFIAVTLTGFIPTSLKQVAAVQAGSRPPLPPVLHAHAVLMGSFLVLLLAQSVLAATGRLGAHRQLGMLAFAIAPGMVIATVLLVPATYQMYVDQWQAAPPEMQEHAAHLVVRRHNLLLEQFRIGIVFAALVAIGLGMRRRDGALHKRLMVLAAAVTLAPAIARLGWLPRLPPAAGLPSVVRAYLNVYGYECLLIAPMFLWDALRGRAGHRAYRIYAAVTLPVLVAIVWLWDTPGWDATARALLSR